MAFTTDDFEKVWASTSPLTPYEFIESQYKEGWNFIGGTPPSRQMWDFLQKQNDEKSEWLYNNKLDLSGGTMTGAINGNPLTLTADDGNDSASLVLGADGSATWNGKNVLAIESSGSEYIRFTNGLQLCWHFDLVPANSPDGLKVFNFPIPFVTMTSFQLTTVGVNNGRFMNVANGYADTTWYQVAVETMAAGVPIYDVYFWMFALGTWK